MNSERLVKGIYKWKGTRTAGRPKNRWEDDVMKDLKLLKIKNWTKCITNRKEWRGIVEKVKTIRRRRRLTEKLQLGSVSHVLMVCHRKRLYSYYRQVFPHIICPAFLDVPATGLHRSTRAYFVD
jgi:hypothetical protein